MALLRRSFFYYLLALVALATIDFKQVHGQRIGWFVFLLSQSDTLNRANTRVQLYDYLLHVKPDDVQYCIALADNYMLLGDYRRATKYYYKAKSLLKPKI